MRRTIPWVLGLVALAIQYAVPMAVAEEFKFAALREDGTSLGEKLKLAESKYRANDLAGAIQIANALRNKIDSSAFASDDVSNKAKCLLVLSYLGTNNIASAKTISTELLLDLQESLILDPKFETNKASVMAGAPGQLNMQLRRSRVQLGNEQAVPESRITLLMDALFPGHYQFAPYEAQLSDYFKRRDRASKQIEPLRSSIEEIPESFDAETLGSADSLSRVSKASSFRPLSASKINQLSKQLQALAAEAQRLPVGDLRPAVDLSTLAMAAELSGQKSQAEELLRLSIASIEQLAPNYPILLSTQYQLASLLLAHKKDNEFKLLLKDMVAHADHEKALSSTAGLAAAAHDYQLAADLYARVLELKKSQGNKNRPSWLQHYSLILKKLNRTAEANALDNQWPEH
jgi:hypothetical protein